MLEISLVLHRLGTRVCASRGEHAAVFVAEVPLGKPTTQCVVGAHLHPHITRALGERKITSTAKQLQSDFQVATDTLNLYPKNQVHRGEFETLIPRTADFPCLRQALFNFSADRSLRDQRQAPDSKSIQAKNVLKGHCSLCPLIWKESWVESAGFGGFP